MTEPTERNYEQDIAYLLSSFTDGGKSLRSFFNHPQELGSLYSDCWSSI